MIEYTQKEALERALFYLQNLYDEFILEIDAKTTNILRHQLLKAEKGGGPDSVTEKKIRHEWRRESIQLHQRRSDLKRVKDRIAFQIQDVQNALEQLDGKIEPTLVSDPGFFYSAPAHRLGSASIVC